MSFDIVVNKELRRHELDALRAFAMLLGIALHAAMSFTGFPWVVQDSRSHFGYVLFMMAIHGFRMQLFMLVSGYFTMMMLRRRGMPAMLRQRFMRVFLPCMLGLVTVIPALEIASAWAGGLLNNNERGNMADGLPATFRAAIAKNDLDAVKNLIANGKDVNEVDTEMKLSPLAWACLHGDVQAANELLNHGAEPRFKTNDGNTLVHHSAFVGNLEIMQLVIRRGADFTARNKEGSSAFDSASVPIQTTTFIANLLKLKLPEVEELSAGRELCRIDLEKRGVKSKNATDGELGPLGRVRQRYADFLGSDRFKTVYTKHAKPLHLVLTSIFHHLWFLWFLCWMVVISAIITQLLKSYPMPKTAEFLVCSKYRLPAMILLTMPAQLFMGSITPGFGPDTSTGLLPQPHLLIYYCIFFGFGMVYYDYLEDAPQLGRNWKRMIAFSLFILLPLGLATIQKPVFGGILQVTYTWLMVFGLIGCFQSVITQESQRLRYLSDSAYWLYLVHLPLLMILQKMVKNWPLPSFPKYLFVCASATCILLLSYEYLIRYFWVGRLLNGPRERPRAIK
ncbi:MAG: acyltransferase family protein [Isosphaeraceae bacterium]